MDREEQLFPPMTVTNVAGIAPLFLLAYEQPYHAS